jgi:PEP-CTERM motif-containing protein
LRDPAVRRVVRRRRTWYRRRLRVERILVAASLLFVLAAASWQRVARHFALPTLHPSQILPDSFWARRNVRDNLVVWASSARDRSVAHARVYPYSVIPGGVRDANELREMAARDYVVARHFARFNYRRAHLVRTNERRAVFLSYRVRDKIFWTRKKVNLQPGEWLLTDDSVTARTRCGNQISETPKPEVSEEEPAEEVLDQPVDEIEPIGPSVPLRLALAKPSLPGATSTPPRPPRLFAGGFIFPLAGIGAAVSGVCETPAQELWEKSHGIVDNVKAEKKCRVRHKPPVVPEPGTLLLISSGLAAVYWRYRRTRRPVSA